MAEAAGAEVKTQRQGLTWPVRILPQEGGFTQDKGECGRSAPHKATNGP